MKQLTVISGKGGTGKTSISAAFAALAERAVLTDCDVDASNLHLLLDPRLEEEEEFRAGFEAVIDPELCIGCGICAEHCAFDALAEVPEMGPGAPFRVDPRACEGCGLCVHLCPEKAVQLRERTAGRWFVSDTRHGPLVHARLHIGAENSGKLVTRLRTRAKEICLERGLDLVIADGAPGVGCPVIASITGCDLLLAVSEPTLSGLHDLRRAAALAAHFKIPLIVAINKFDLNEEMGHRIQDWCSEEKLPVAGCIPFSEEFGRAMDQKTSIIELGRGPASEAVRALWKATRERLLHHGE